MHEYGLKPSDIPDLELDEYIAMLEFLRKKAEAEAEAMKGKGKDRDDGFKPHTGISLKGKTDAEVAQILADLKSKAKQKEPNGTV